ncbi:MAG: hypothetical protein IJL10_04990, partial [Synergistaceae bacterium]|nr:hypothetical protein [Synergistaceae bacterium]
MDGMIMRTKNLFFRIITALVISQGFYYAVDSITVKRWDNTESLIVRVISAGEERVVEAADQDSYEMLER